MSVLYYIKRAFSLLFLVGSALTLFNLYGNNDAVVAQAAAVACAKACVRMLRAERSAFAQSFTFQIGLQPPATANVRCERAYVLLGPYTCAPSRD